MTEPLTFEQIWGEPADDDQSAVETSQEIEDRIRYGCTWPGCGDCTECYAAENTGTI